MTRAQTAFSISTQHSALSNQVQSFGTFARRRNFPLRHAKRKFSQAIANC